MQDKMEVIITKQLVSKTTIKINYITKDLADYERLVLNYGKENIEIVTKDNKND